MGLGLIMLDFLKRWACKIGLHFGWLDTTFNIEVRKMLRNHGFVVVNSNPRRCPVCYRVHTWKT